MKTAIFDLDGTLADTSGDLIAAANECFRELGFDVPLDESKDQLLAFRGGRAMLREGYRRLTGNAESENVIDARYRRLLEHYENAIDHCSVLYPAVENALETLQQNGWRLSVCTNKPERLARLLLDSLGIGPMFGALVGGDTLPVCKPNPAPVRKVVEMVGGDLGKSFILGDTATDSDAARAAGTASVLVAFGPEGRGISRLEPDALLDHYDDLPELAEIVVNARSSPVSHKVA